MSRRTKFLLCFMFGLTLLILPTLTLACGGFFCMATPIDQSAERIIFTINGDGTITAIVGINYTGAAEDFSWVVPVPSPPVLDVAETQSLTALQLATDVQFTTPDSYCSRLYEYFGRGGGGGGDMFLEQGHVGPYDYAILGSEDPDEMITWLRDNGYRITEDMEPLIAVYVEEDMYFLAMKLSQEAEVGDIQPVVMTYESTEPMIPIRLTAVAAVPNMPIITWIFADERYVPRNYVHPTPDFSRFAVSNRVDGIGKNYGFFDGGFDDFGNYISPDEANYRAEQRRIQDRYDGLAFITEFAAPASQLPAALDQDALLNRLRREYGYVTRLRAQMSPEQMTIDPYFVPAPGAPDVSNVIDLNAHVDPLHYWGCSSRTALSATTIANLPPAHTRITTLRLDVRYPANWQQSTFSMDGTAVRVFAPQAVDATTIAAAFRGDDIPPMFVIAPFHMGIDDNGSVQQRLGTILGKAADMPWPGQDNSFPLNWRFTPFQYEGAADVIGLVMLANNNEWQRDGDTYRAMLDYAASFQYYLGWDLANTLILSSYGVDQSYLRPVMLGYPDGWIEQTDENGDVRVIPEDADGVDTPAARLLDLGTAVAIEPRSGIELVTSLYGLAGDSAAALLADPADLCQPDVPVIPFEHDGRQGYLSFAGGYLVEASAPAVDFAAYDDTLLHISGSLEAPVWECSLPARLDSRRMWTTG